MSEEQKNEEAPTAKSVADVEAGITNNTTDQSPPAEQPVAQPVEPAAQAMADIEPKVTNETAAQAETSVPTPVRFSRKATIEWSDAEGKLVEKYEVFRNMTALAKDVCNKAEDSKYASLNVHVYLTEENKPESKPLTVAKGTAQDVAKNLVNKAMDNPMMIMHQLQLIILRLFEISSLKGIVVTAVVDDAKIGGYGIVNDVIDVTDEDLKTLGAAASNQADQYKDYMRKTRNIEFPGDSRIITATQMPASKRP